MRRILLYGVSVLLLSGCAAGNPRSSEEPGHVADVRSDLKGMNAADIGTLAQSYARGGKVFLYSSPHTDSPIVSKSDVPFAVQFRTAPVQGGFKEALSFNECMLEYMRARLREGVCPEHPQTRVMQKDIRVKRPAVKGGKGKGMVTSKRTPFVTERILICPVDKRVFRPYDLEKKPKLPREPAQEKEFVPFNDSY